MNGGMLMGECRLNHSIDDVRKKLEEQAPYLPNDLYQKLNLFLDQNLDQATLNETFHLLKKYDLAPHEEQLSRQQKIKALLHG
jgi:hypothetical protein